MNQLHVYVKDELYVKLARKLGARFLLIFDRSDLS
jgi:hypothetical protein